MPHTNTPTASTAANQPGNSVQSHTLGGEMPGSTTSHWLHAANLVGTCPVLNIFMGTVEVVYIYGSLSN